VTRVLICAVLAVVAVACDGGGPDGSYIYPTAIIGIPLQSEDEAKAIQAAVAELGKRHGLKLYRPADVPFFREQGYGVYPHTTYYKPPLATYDFSLGVRWWPPHCMLVQLSEQSGIWTPESLAAFEDLKRELARATQARATVFVPPKRLQNWPDQQRQSDPERPARLEEFCMRMGLPDPREKR
jgi:hypothetical protein